MGQYYGNEIKTEVYCFFHVGIGILCLFRNDFPIGQLTRYETDLRLMGKTFEDKFRVFRYFEIQETCIFYLTVKFEVVYVKNLLFNFNVSINSGLYMQIIKHVSLL